MSTLKAFRPFYWGCLSVAACLLGMATKEVMVSAPVIVFLYDRTFVSGTFREAWRRHRTLYAGLASTWILLLYLALGSGTRGSTAGMNVGVSPVNYWLTQFPAVVHYLSLVFWPAPLVLDYGTQLVQSAWSVLPAIAIVMALAAATVWAFTAKVRNLRALGFAGVFFFAILAPTSVVPVIVQVMAEHRMYLALAPVVAVVVTGGYAIINSKFGIRNSKFVFLPLCLGAAAALGFVTARRNADYRNGLTLWGKTAAESPDNPRAQYNFGTVLSDAGDIPGAMEHYRIALHIRPDYPEAHNDLGIALYDTNHWPEAIAEYNEAVRLDPRFAKAYNNLGNAFLRMGNAPEAIANYDEARRLLPDYPDFDYNLGIALTSAGRLAEAIPVYERALRLKPDYARVQINLAQTHNSLGIAVAETGHPEEAMTHFQEAVRLSPDNPDFEYNLGNALHRLGKFPEAGARYERALRLKPDFPKARNNLGNVRRQMGNLSDAVLQYQEALRLKPDYVEAHNNLGRVLAQLGRTSEARTQFEQALRLAPDDAEARANLAQLPHF